VRRVIRSFLNLSRETRGAAWLTVGTWTLSGLLYLLPYQLFRSGAGNYVFASVMLICASGALLSSGVFAVARRMRGRSTLSRFAAMAGAVMAASALLALIDVSAIEMLRGLTRPGEASAPLAMRATNNFVALVWQFALLAAAYTILEANALAAARERELAAARETASRAEAAASAARLAALRYQLNPHFLFNTLNAVSSLVVTRRNAEADAMLAKLSDFLRATLSAEPEGLVALEDELATLQHYLEIEAVRFADRLEVAFDLPDELRDALVPGFILQPLVENAIRYAVAPDDRPVSVRVSAAQDGAALLIKVDDDGDPAKAATVRGGTGVGLVNVRQRLAVHYGAGGVLEAGRTGAGWRAALRLPLAMRTDAPPEARAA
jgi:signal transduction histidine kinase